MNLAPRRCETLEALPAAERIVTIGTFDGVHRGHRRLLEAAVERARALGLPACVLTFEPVPASVLRPDLFSGRICSPEEKQAQLAASGVDEIVTLTFDLAFSQQSPEEFMGRVTSATRPRELWVGEGFALGKNRAGNVARLTELGAELGFAVRAMPRLTNGDEVISSSAIRGAVLAGDVARAHRFLERPFRVGGEVIHGAHLGRTIGYPTANVVPPEAIVPLADGIYASFATLADEAPPRPAMTYVGARPTVNSGARLVETHLFDFDGDLYGQTIAVDLIERIRDDEAFVGLDALVAQLRRDEAAARAIVTAFGGGGPRAPKEDGR